MKKIFKGTVSLLLCTAIAASFAGCAKKGVEVQTSSVIEDPNVTEPGKLPIVKEKVTITAAAFSDSNIENYNENAYTKFLEEKTGIDLEIQAIVNPQQKLKLMFAADDPGIPEVIFGTSFSPDMLMKYGNNGMGTVLDLGPYMDNYGYYVNEMLTKTTRENVDKMLYTADGGRYFMPSFTEQTGNEYSGKAFINKKWLDKLGLEMPKTTADLEKVLVAFANEDPNGNGQKDEIAYTACANSWQSKPVEFLINSFIYHDYSTTGMIADKKGKVSTIYMTKEYEEAIKYVNGLVEKGAFDKLCLTQSMSELRSVIASSPVSRIGVYVGASPDEIWRSNMQQLVDEYVALPPLEGPEGKAYALRTAPKLTTAGIITKNCKNPLAAFRLLDYMLSEEASIRARFGVDEKDWKYATDKDKSLFESINAPAKIIPILPWGSMQNSHWMGRGPYFISAEYANGMAWDGNPLNGEKVKGDALGAYIGKEYEYRFMNEQFTESELEEKAVMETDIANFISQEQAKFVLGQRPLSEFDKFRQQLTDMNIERFVEIHQLGYDRGNKE